MDTSPKDNLTQPVDVEPGPGLIRFYPLRHRKLNHWLAIPAGILLFLLALTSLLYGFFTTWTAIERHGRAVALGTITPFILTSLLAFIIGLVLLVSTRRHWNDGVGIYPSGIALHRGKNVDHISWEQVKRFDSQIKLIKFATSVMDIRSKIILETEDNRKFKITNRVADMQDLIHQLREQLLPRLYEKSLQTLHQGGQISFHRQLTANLNTLYIKGQQHPWERLTPVIKNRVLVIRQLTNQEVLFKGKINQFQNTDILLAFLENPPPK